MLRGNRLILLWTIQQLYQLEPAQGLYHQGVYQQVRFNPWSAPIPPYSPIHNKFLPQRNPSPRQVNDEPEALDNSLPFEADNFDKDFQDDNGKLVGNEEEEDSDAVSDLYQDDVASDSDYQFPEPFRTNRLFQTLQGLQTIREFNQAKYRDSMREPQLKNLPDFSMNKEFNTRSEYVDDIPRPDNTLSKSRHGTGNLGNRYIGPNFDRPSPFSYLDSRNSFRPIESRQPPIPAAMNFPRRLPQVTSLPLPFQTALPIHQREFMVFQKYSPNTPLWRSPLLPNISPLQSFIPQPFAFKAPLSPLQSGRIPAVFDFSSVGPMPSVQRAEMLPLLPKPLPPYFLSDQFKQQVPFAPTPNRILPRFDNTFISLNLPELRLLFGSQMGSVVSSNRLGFQGFNRNFPTMQMGRSYSSFPRPIRKESIFIGGKVFPANWPMPYFPLPNHSTAPNRQLSFQRQYRGQVSQNRLNFRNPQPFFSPSGMRHPSIRSQPLPQPIHPPYFRAPFWTPRSPSSLNRRPFVRSQITLPPSVVLRSGAQMPQPGVNRPFPRISPPFNPTPWFPNRSRLPLRNIPYPYGPNSAYGRLPRAPLSHFNPLLSPQQMHL